MHMTPMNHAQLNHAQMVMATPHCRATQSPMQSMHGDHYAITDTLANSGCPAQVVDDCKIKCQLNACSSGVLGTITNLNLPTPSFS
jgi:hypothetical protein